MEKDRVLIIGATGYLGKKLVKASIALDHPTFILYRQENASDLRKCQMFMEFKMDGAVLLEGSFGDHESLVSALKQVDVVISCIGSECIMDQLKLVEAIKQVDTIKRYLPSEFGMDVDRMEHAIAPGGQLFTEKRVVRRAIEEANIPHTYVSANCLAGFFLAGLAQLANFMPPRNHVNIHGNGDRKCKSLALCPLKNKLIECPTSSSFFSNVIGIYVEETDAAMYTILAIDDPRTVNKVLYVRPLTNNLTQMEMVQIWEKLTGKELKKTFLTEDEWLLTMDKVPPFDQVAVAHMYRIFYLGDLDFEVVGPHGIDSSVLYPDHRYVTAEEYLKRFV